MLYYAVKIVLSALLIVAISEIAKRHSGMAALPLISLTSFGWLHVEGASSEQVATVRPDILAGSALAVAVSAAAPAAAPGVGLLG